MRVQESWEKVIAERDGHFDLDHEVLRTEGAIAYGLTDSTLVELEFDSGVRVHGILDPLMIGFHNSFGVPLGPRGRLPNNAFRTELNPGDGRPTINLDREAGGAFDQALVLSCQHALTSGDDTIPAISCAASLRPRLGSLEQLHGGSPVALSGSLSLSKAWGDFRFYLAGDLSWYGQERFDGTSLRSYDWSLLAAVEWNCLTDFSLLLQIETTRGIVRDFGAFSEPSTEIAYGFKWEILKNLAVGLAMIHDVFNPENTPDFGFHLELSLRW